jgi:HAD superfamily hydrolase (TIGR01549 family)
MKKAVFFDLNRTLIDYLPSREDMEQKELAKMGHHLPMDIVNKSFLKADEYFYGECAQKPLIERTREEKNQIFYNHQHLVQKYCGLTPTKQSVMHIMICHQEQCTTQGIFEDAKETLLTLRQRGIKTGLLSNSDGDISPVLKETGLDTLLDIIITSAKYGVTKPSAAIFEIALREADIDREEMLYIGDQIEIDMTGAQNAGIDFLLIYRHNFYEEAPCQRIRDMRQVFDYL